MMNVSMKKMFLFPFFLLISSFSFGEQVSEERDLFGDYAFFEKEDCIKIRIKLPEGVMKESTISKVNNYVGSEFVRKSFDQFDQSAYQIALAVKIRNDSLGDSKEFPKLVDVTIAAIRGNEGAWFEITERTENNPLGTLKNETFKTRLFFLKTNKMVDFKENILPPLSCVKGSPYTKYVRFYTKE